MKRLMVIILVMMMCSVAGMAQEPPEPVIVSLSVDPLQDFQARWSTTGEWETIVIGSWEIVDGAVTEPHQFISNVSPMNFSVLMPAVLNAPARKMNFIVPQQVIENHLTTNFWDVIRVRCRLRVVTSLDGVPFISEPTAWLTPSWWVLIVNLDAISTGSPVNTDVAG